MLRTYMIYDKASKTSTYFFAESDDVAKRQYLLTVCQSPFYNDFVLVYTGYAFINSDLEFEDFDKSDNTFVDCDCFESYVIDVTEEEVDSYIKMIERQKAIRMSVYESRKQKENKE